MGFIDTVFGEPDTEEFLLIPEIPEAVEARETLLEIAQGPLPEVPLQEIAPLQPTSEETEAARSTALELIESQDIFALPEVQAIIQQVTAEGDLLTNRLGRILQASGNLTSTTGRDALGRAVSDIQSTLTASLAPFASEERDRRLSLIPILSALGFAKEELPRIIEQAELDALFNQQTIESNQIQDFLVPILQQLTGLTRSGAIIEVEGDIGLIEQFSLIASLFAGSGG